MEDTLRLHERQKSCLPTAPTSCTACHSKKRKCDKQLPACARCSKNRQQCRYVNLPIKIEDSLDLSSISNIRIDSTEKIIADEVLRVMEEQSIDRTHVMDRYTKYLHHWLPIIDLDRICTRIQLTCMLETMDVELASVLLSIHLATQPSSTGHRGKAPMESLYILAQKIFFSLQLTRGFSLCTVQCGLLMAVYQIGAGLLSEAYVTLSTTTGLIRAGQILSSHHHNNNKNSSHEAKIVWWAAFLLDRILALASLPNNLPLLMEQPRYLGDLPDTHTLRPSPDNEEHKKQYDYFLEEIHAACLAGKVLQCMDNSLGRSESDLGSLNRDIMTHLEVMFRKSTGSWRPFCSAIAILLVTAVELQFTMLTRTITDEEAAETCRQALSTHLKITIDITRNYLEDQDTAFANGIVPITSVISDYHTLVGMCKQRELGHPIMADFAEGSFALETSLKKKSQIWGLADRYIRDLTDSTV